MRCPVLIGYYLGIVAVDVQDLYFFLLLFELCNLFVSPVSFPELLVDDQMIVII